MGSPRIKYKISYQKVSKIVSKLTILKFHLVTLEKQIPMPYIKSSIRHHLILQITIWMNQSWISPYHAFFSKWITSSLQVYFNDVNASPCVAHCELFNNLKIIWFRQRFDPQNLVSNVLSFMRVLTPILKLGLDSLAIKKIKIKIEVLNLEVFVSHWSTEIGSLE